MQPVIWIPKYAPAIVKSIDILTIIILSIVLLRIPSTEIYTIYLKMNCSSVFYICAHNWGADASIE